MCGPVRQDNRAHGCAWSAPQPESPTDATVYGGVLYGTTQYGGGPTSGSSCFETASNYCGTVFELTPPATPGGTWTETILHSFTDQNGEGSFPGSSLVWGPEGVLYGTTPVGGTAGAGTIFAVAP